MARQAQYPKQVVILVSNEVDARLRKLDEKTGLGMSEIARRAIDNGLEAVERELGGSRRKSVRTAS